MGISQTTLENIARFLSKGKVSDECQGRGDGEKGMKSGDIEATEIIDMTMDSGRRGKWQE